MEWPGTGEAWNCRGCNKVVLGAGSWGINPDAVCHCANPQPMRSFVMPTAGLIGNGLSGGFQNIPEIERRRCYDTVLAEFRHYRKAIDDTIFFLECLQKTERSKIAKVDLTNAPMLRRLLEQDVLSEKQQEAIAELEALASQHDPAHHT